MSLSPTLSFQNDFWNGWSFSLTQKLPWKWSEKRTDKLTFQTAACTYSQWQTQVNKRGIQSQYILFPRHPLIWKNGAARGLLQMDKNRHRCILVEGFKKSSQDLKLNTWECWFLLLLGYGTKVTWSVCPSSVIVFGGGTAESTLAVPTFAATWVQALCSHLSTTPEKIVGYTLNWAKKQSQHV